jgi:exodeoxyribonuclease VIII
MNSPIHVSCDLETLSLQPNALVLSIGLAAFTLPGGIVKQGYWILEQQTQRAHGRHVDPRTLDWWQHQSKEAREVFTAPGTDTAKALEAVAQWFGGLPELAGVWGFGADFDNAILQSLYRDFGLSVPWSYKLNRCGRTVTALAPCRRPPRHGAHHNAMDDAAYQAATIRDSLMVIQSHRA